MTPEPAPTPTQVPRVRSSGLLVLSKVPKHIFEIWLVLRNICESKVDFFWRGGQLIGYLRSENYRRILELGHASVASAYQEWIKEMVCVDCSKRNADVLDFTYPWLDAWNEVDTSKGFKGLFDRSVGQKIQAQIWMVGLISLVWFWKKTQGDDRPCETCATN